MTVEELRLAFSMGAIFTNLFILYALFKYGGLKVGKL